jgi:Collagen triple helix repeat (20 copies)
MAWQPKGNIKGPKGDTGQPGSTGATGPPGATGPQGTKGDKGDQGSAGSQGPQGPIGLTGPQGAQGTQGTPGTPGATGAQGPKGDTGAAGATGATGQAEQWWSGSGAPSSGLGAVGDFYLNTATGDVSEKTTTTTWITRTNIRGPQGPAGTFPTYASLQTACNLSASVVGTVTKHCGFGATGKITPTTSGKVLVRIVTGSFSTSPGGANYFSFGSGKYGTGAAPAANAAPTGTDFGNTVQSPVQSGGMVTGCEITQLLQLTVGTTYWFDMILQASNAAATAAISFGQVQAIELP